MANQTTQAKQYYSMHNTTVEITKEIQRLLYKHQCGTLGQKDGTWGKDTQEAIEQFQYSHNLQVTGIVGPDTMKALRAQHTGALNTDDLPHLSNRKINQLRSHINRNLGISQRELDICEKFFDEGGVLRSGDQGLAVRIMQKMLSQIIAAASLSRNSHMQEIKITGKFDRTTQAALRELGIDAPPLTQFDYGDFKKLYTDRKTVHFNERDYSLQG